MTSPDFPWLRVKVTVRLFALPLGIMIEEIGTNSAEVSNRTKNKELVLRVANSTHNTKIS